MRLWVFSNRTYGFGSDIAEAALFEGARRKVRSTLVVSARDISPSNAWRVRVALIRSMARRSGVSRVLLRPRVLVVNDVNGTEFRQRIGDEDIGLISGFHQIFARGLLDRFASIVNVHPSVLPYYRGPVPSRWCIANGEKRSGFSIHRVSEKIDAGEILYQQTVDIPQASDEESLDRLLSRRGAEIIPSFLGAMLERTSPPRRLENAESVYRCPVDYAGFDGVRFRTT